MILPPYSLPGLTPTASGRKSRLLFHWRASDLRLTSLTGQAPTFSRASAGGAVGDLNGMLVVPVHSQPRYEMVDTDGDGIRDSAGLLIEYGRTNKAAQSDNFAAWTGGGSPPTPVAGYADPLGGTGAYLLTDNDGAVTQSFGLACTLTGDGTKSFAINLAKSSALITAVRLVDDTAGIVRGSVTVDWSSSPPTVAVAESTAAVVLKVRARANGFYRIEVQVPSCVAANTNRLYVRPAGLVGTSTGSVIAFRAQVEDAAYPSSDIATAGSTVARSTDRLTYPCNLGPLTAATDDFTLYARFARPSHADAVGDISPDFPGILCLGGSQADLRLYFNATSRTYRAVVRDGAALGATQAPAVPAGAVLELVGQFTDLTTNPGVAYDTGSGISGFVRNGLAPIYSFGTPLIGVGEISGGTHKLGAPLFSAKIAQGLLSMDQMRQAL